MSLYPVRFCEFCGRRVSLDILRITRCCSHCKRQVPSGPRCLECFSYIIPLPGTLYCQQCGHRQLSREERLSLAAEKKRQAQQTLLSAVTTTSTTTSTTATSSSAEKSPEEGANPSSIADAWDSPEVDLAFSEFASNLQDNVESAVVVQELPAPDTVDVNANENEETPRRRRGYKRRRTERK